MDKTKSTTQKVGWGILLAIAGLMVLNGLAWFFSGPKVNLESPLEAEGVSVSEFSQAYPAMVDQIANDARQVAIWFGAFGIVWIAAAVEGLRHGSRWARNLSWTLVAVPVAVGLVYLGGGGLGFANVGFISIGALALVGLLLARSGAAPQPSA